MPERSIQSQLEGNLCFGCGQANERGLRIESFFADGKSICRFQPAPQHSAGPPHVVNGGILATIIDCHAVCTAIAAAYQAEARPLGSEPPIWYVTGSLRVDYLRPAPIDQPLVLRAWVRESEGRKTWLEVSALANEEEVARASVLAVRVRPEWRRAEGS